MSFEKRSTPRVACVGIAGVDLIHHIDAFPSQPVKLRARAFSTSVGGMAAGAACAVARLGTAAQYWGPVGTDAFGDMVRVELERAGHNADAAHPGLRAHLHGCPACREEHDSLHALAAQTRR